MHSHSVNCKWIEDRADEIAKNDYLPEEAHLRPHVEQHLAECQSCRDRVEQCRRLQAILRGSPRSAVGFGCRTPRRVPRRLVPVLVGGLALSVAGNVGQSVSLRNASDRSGVYSLQVDADRREVRLQNWEGREVYTWCTSGMNGVSAALLVQQPLDHQSRPLVVLGYDQDLAQAHPGQLVAFNVRGMAEWAAGVEEADIPGDLLSRPGRDYQGNQFGVSFCEAADIFPTVPGNELVAVFQHGMYSQCSVRVYALDGTLLYQAWHDGNVFDVLWLEGTHQLVCLGYNSEVDAWKRGLDTQQQVHPFVMFALTPIEGSVEPKWVDTVDHQGGVRPEWYRCLLSDWATDAADMVRIGRPFMTWDPQSYVWCEMAFHTKWGTARVGMAIDEKGRQVSNPCVPSDEYERGVESGLLQPHDVITWGELPPIRDRSGEWIPDAGPTEGGSP